MKIDIVKKVNIAVTQADIEALIIAKIRDTDPEINVNSIEFTMKRKPAELVATVDADFGEGNTTEPTKEEEPVDAAMEAAEAEPEVEAPVVMATEAEITEEDAPRPSKLFGN